MTDCTTDPAAPAGPPLPAGVHLHVTFNNTANPIAPEPELASWKPFLRAVGVVALVLVGVGFIVGAAVAGGGPVSIILPG